MHKILICLSLFILPLGAMAQLSVGIRGGYATSTYSYQASAATRSRSVDGIGSPTFSFVVEYFNSKNAGIELNLQQLTLGFRQFNGDEKLNQTELTYLKVPLLASFFAGRSGRFQIKVGPHLGYLLQAKDITREFEGETPRELPTYGGAGDVPNKLMYGLTAGAGISKLFGKSTLSAEVRFGYDFTNPESQGRIFDMSSTNLEFTLAYLFRIKERKF
ncbi:Outer membrane protein beta-barrel domain-containing protein [Algoriphagus alkaliphilus]|uniref:Outer membrane protein beta-barrel domain-containing protein n=1 Tax=Algoriphagus alkaliphilus TaxID=279824 RepID=A0A1G5YQJ4_9BACT|nr:porin family protein [Algoriphagus alkaliphilus]MBA4299535.1 PorT family protein [Cyclobacterium sp.]SDA84612.1 Outer membrane protein beta-barrel domain-containing protein [Algoriphagus alkaliphilus]